MISISIIIIIHPHTSIRRILPPATNEMTSANEISFLDAVKIRRSVVAVNKSSLIPDERVVSIVEQAIKHAPSAFNVNSCRAVVLFGGEHDKLWDIAMKRSKETMPPQVFASLESKIKGYHDSYGTVSSLVLRVSHPRADFSWHA